MWYTGRKFHFSMAQKEVHEIVTQAEMFIKVLHGKKCSVSPFGATNVPHKISYYNKRKSNMFISIYRQA